MGIRYTVVNGDKLRTIAQKFYDEIEGDSLSGPNGKVQTLVRLNNIVDPNKLAIGQELWITKDASDPDVEDSNKRAIIVAFGRQSGTINTIYASWKWTLPNTENYKVKWEYDTGDGLWFIGNSSTVDEKQATYIMPDNATKIRFMVKPIAKKIKQNGNDVDAFTSEWSSARIYYAKDLPPDVPSNLDVKIEKYQLTASVNNLAEGSNYIEFEIMDVSKGVVFKSVTVEVKFRSASYSCGVTAGKRYKVKCRAWKAINGSCSEWSADSNECTTTPPSPVIKTCEAVSKNEIRITWDRVDSANTYEIQYVADKASYFDVTDKPQTITIDTDVTSWVISFETGEGTGKEYFFRMRCGNETDTSGWSDIKSCTVGQPPSAPTTWSSTTTYVVGDPSGELKLYWMHNSKDGSPEKVAELYASNDSGMEMTQTITKSQDEDERNKPSVFVLDKTWQSWFVDGGFIRWKVRTSGVTMEPGDWSVERIVKLYSPPTIRLIVSDTDEYLDSSESISVINSFPFYIFCEVGPENQAPVTYSVNVVSNEAYETVDSTGNVKMVNAGDEVYSKVFIVGSNVSQSKILRLKMNASDLDLQNNVTYTINVIVAMNSGLTVSESHVFTVSWTEKFYEPNAEIGIDTTTYTALIRPYCMNRTGALVKNVKLSVYRREFDGGMVEIATDLDNERGTVITDPHPSLDFARYRIIATEVATGAVSYYDPPGYPVNGKAVIIQWDEAWTNFDADLEGELSEPEWTGSMIKLPYNIDIQEVNTNDVTLIKYAGRRHPVSYHGTHTGETATWNVDIAKEDKETIYALRRLARWLGNVYVREPSGTSYWATISVSFPQKHNEVTVPVSLSITRVAGGM